MDIPHASKYRGQNQGQTQQRRAYQHNNQHRGNENTGSNFWPKIFGVCIATGALLFAFAAAPVLTVLGVLVTVYVIDRIFY